MTLLISIISSSNLINNYNKIKIKVIIWTYSKISTVVEIPNNQLYNQIYNNNLSHSLIILMMIYLEILIQLLCKVSLSRNSKISLIQILNNPNNNSNKICLMISEIFLQLNLKINNNLIIILRHL